MIIDFHCHSNASDGAHSPEDLWTQACAAGIEQFALTDHDTVAGYLALRDAPREGDMRLRSGVELSCVWSQLTIHVVGLDFDPDHGQMAAGLERLQQARQDRAQAISERLQRLGFAGALEGALAEAGRSQLGRPHFAAWMVAQGHVADFKTAFDKYLGAGKVGDVKAFWPTLDEVTGWIVSAGGVAILAHPMKYKLTNMKLRRLVAAFVGGGGGAIEIFSGRQTHDQTVYLGKLAADFELPVSAGSDFHRTLDYGPTLGVDVERLPIKSGLWSEP